MQKRRTVLVGRIILVLALLMFGLPNRLVAETLAGTIGSSSEWGSGWLLLGPPIDFAKGDHLKLLVGGSATKVIVRLLPKGGSPDSTVGIVGGPVDVPKSRVVEIVLPNDRPQVIQISVHGGPNPWGKFSIGGGNGPATIESAERTKP
jgi:hypothetical protein